MITYTVHEPPGPPADRADRAALLSFIKDGFDWSVLFFGPLALLMKGLFVATAAYVATLVGLVLIVAAIDAEQSWLSLAYLALNAVFAFEVNEFERRKLDRKGWLTHGSVSGRNRYECERRFLESWLPRQAMVRSNRSIDRATGDGSGSGAHLEASTAAAASGRRSTLRTLAGRFLPAKPTGATGG